MGRFAAMKAVGTQPSTHSYRHPQGVWLISWTTTRQDTRSAQRRLCLRQPKQTFACTSTVPVSRFVWIQTTITSIQHVAPKLLRQQRPMLEPFCILMRIPLFLIGSCIFLKLTKKTNFCLGSCRCLFSLAGMIVIFAATKKMSNDSNAPLDWHRLRLLTVPLQLWSNLTKDAWVTRQIFGPEGPNPQPKVPHDH